MENNYGIGFKMVAPINLLNVFRKNAKYGDSLTNREKKMIKKSFEIYYKGFGLREFALYNGGVISEEIASIETYKLLKQVESKREEIKKICFIATGLLDGKKI